MSVCFSCLFAISLVCCLFERVSVCLCLWICLFARVSVCLCLWICLFVFVRVSVFVHLFVCLTLEHYLDMYVGACVKFACLNCVYPFTHVRVNVSMCGHVCVHKMKYAFVSMNHTPRDTGSAYRH